MPFLINGKIIDSDIAPDSLLENIMQAPSCMETPENIIRFSTLPQDHMIGTQEKGYVVINASDDSTIRIGGTDGILHCIGLSFHDPATRKLVIAHLDIGTNVNALSQILELFKEARTINIRLFGGLTHKEAESIAGTTHHDSVALAKNICQFLYTFANTSSCNLNIISADLFEKLYAYKKYAEENNLSSKIGFAVDSESGCLIASTEHPLPFTTIVNNCGLFQGVFKERGICVRVHEYLGYSSEDLSKRYDNSTPDWYLNHQQEIEERSKLGLVRILIRELNRIELAPINQLQTDFIFNHLEQFLDELRILKKPFHQLLLEHIGFEVLRNTHDKLAQLPYQRNDQLPLEQIIASEIIQKWCVREIRRWIADHLANGDEEHSIQFIQALSSFKGGLHLLNEFLKYQQTEEDVAQHNKLSNSTFIAQLKNAHPDARAKIIHDWKDKTINEGINRFATKILSNLNKPYNGQESRKMIINILLKIFSEFDQNAFNLDILHPLNHDINQRLNHISNELNQVFSDLHRQILDMRATSTSESSFFQSLCCLPRRSNIEPTNINQAIEDRVNSAISETLNKYISDMTQIASSPELSSSSSAAAASSSEYKPGFK